MQIEFNKLPFWGEYQQFFPFWGEYQQFVNEHFTFSFEIGEVRKLGWGIYTMKSIEQVNHQTFFTQNFHFLGKRREMIQVCVLFHKMNNSYCH